MKKSKSAFLFALFTLVLLVSVSAISAADINSNDTITYNSVTSDTTTSAIETADNNLPDKTSDNNNLKSVNPNPGQLGAEYELEVDDLEAYDYSIDEYYNIKNGPITIGSDDDIKLALHFYDMWSDEGYNVEGYELTLTDNGSYVGSNTTDNNEYWYYTITSPAVGEHNFVVSFAGNEIFEPFNATGSVVVSEESHIEPEVVIDDIEFYDPNDDYEVEVESPLTLVGTVYDVDYNGVPNVEVLIYEDDVQIGTSITNTSGVFEYAYVPTTAGNHVLYAMNGTKKSVERTVTVKSTINPIDLEVDALCAWDEDLEDYVPITDGVIIALGNDIRLKQSVTDMEGGSVSGLTFIASVDSVDYTNTTDSNGNWYYTISSPDEGEYYIEVSFDGNLNYNNFLTYGTVIIRDQSINYEVTYLEFYDPFDEYELAMGETLTFSGSAYDMNHSSTPVPNAEISIYEDDVLIGTATTDIYGDYEFVYEPSSMGTHVLYAINGTTKSDERTVTVNKAESFIRLNDSMVDENQIDVGQNFTISGTLLSNNVPISDAEIVIKVTDDDNTSHVITDTVQTDADGKFSYNYMPLPYGVKQLNVTFEGNDDYAPYSTGEDGYTFEVINPGVNIELLTVETEAKWKDSVNWSASVTYTNGTPFPTGRVSFNLKNATNMPWLTSPNIIDGVACNNTTIPYSLHGEYELVLICFDTPGDDDVNEPYSKVLANVTLGTFTVNPASFNITIDAPDEIDVGSLLQIGITVKVNDEIYFEGNVPVNFYRPDDLEHTKFWVGTVNYRNETVWANRTVGANLYGDYLIGAQYRNNTVLATEYKPITVYTNKTLIINASDVEEETRAGETIQINGTVTFTNSTPADGILLNVTVNDEYVGTVKTDDLGAFTYNVTAQKNNTIVFSYKSNEDTVTFTAIPQSFISVTTQGDNLTNVTTIVANVTDAQTGESVIGGNLTLTDKENQTITGTLENTGGNLTFTLNGLPAGEHTFELVYTGNTEYEGTTTEITVLVNKIQTKVIANVTNNVYNNTTLGVSVLDKDNTPITEGKITINNQEYNITGETTTIPIYVDITGANVTVTYKGNYTYDESSAVVEVIPIKRDVNLNIDLTNDIVGSATLTVDIADLVTGEANATGNILVSVDDAEYNGTIENGAAIVDLSELASGNYTASVTYSGDDYYNGKTIIGLEITIERRNTTTTVTVVNNTYGNVTLEVAVSAVDQGSTPVTNGTITIGDESFEITGESTVVPVSVDIVGANVTVNYMGDDTYNGSLAVVEVIPDKRDVSLDSDLTNDVVGSATLFVEVSDSITGEFNATGDVVVTIGSDEYNGTIENGIAIIDLSDLEVGTYTASVAYSGDDYYNDKTIIGLEIDIVLRNTTTTVTVVNNTYGNVSIAVAVNAVDQGNTPVTNGTITVNGETYNITGETTIVPVSVDIVGANVTVNYMGDDIYNGSSAVVEVIPDKRDVSLDSEVTNDVVGSATLSVGVADLVTGEVNATGNIVVTIDDVEYNGTIENGIAIVDLSDLAVGSYSVDVAYIGDDYYNAKTVTTGIVIERRNTTTTVSIVNNTYGNVSVSVSVNAVDQGSTPVTNGTITVNGETYNVTGESTVVPVSVDIVGANVTVNYMGDDTYNESSYVIEIIPDKRNVRLDAEMTNDIVGSATLFVEVSDSITGEFNATGDVIVTIEGAKYNGTIENGIAVIDLSDLAVGTYSPSVVYSGDDYYNDKAIIGLEIDIVLRNTTTTVTVMNNTYGNVSVSVAVKAVDQESTPVTNGTITVNGETYNITGETTTIALDLKVGEYEVTVDYAGSDEYAESNNTITINVVALGTTTVVDEVVAYSGDNVTLKATITDDLGNLVNSGKVAFKVNGKTIGTATVSKGVATLNTTALKSWVKDGVTVFAKYAGGSNYVTSNDTADVTVTLKTATVNIITTGVYQPGNNITLMAMVSTDSKVVNSGYVIFKLNGITLTDAQGNIIKANVTNGLAQASYTLSNSIAASNHTITAVFIEENYNRAEDNDTFSVAKAKVLLEINDISINEGQPAILTGKLVDKFGNLVTRSTKITVKINGVSFIAAQTVSNGIINFTLNQSTNGKTSIDKFKLNKIYDIVVYAGENNRNLGANATAILVKK